MTIKPTNKAKGELVIASINRSLRKGQEFPLNEQQYWNEDVQRALALGIVEVCGEISPTLAEGGERLTYRSVAKRPMILPTVPGALTPGKTFTITKTDSKNIDIQQALTLGFIILNEEKPQPIDPVALVAALEGGPMPEPEPKAEEAPVVAKKPAEEKPETTDNDVTAIPPDPEEDVDIEMLDNAERYKKTGEAQVVKHDPPKPTFVPYDPRPAAPQGVAKKGGKKGGKKGIKAVGRVKTASADGEPAAEDDGIEIEMLSDGHSIKID